MTQTQLMVTGEKRMRRLSDPVPPAAVAEHDGQDACSATRR
ncbi:hypothetical protein [Microbacterium suwonense]|nr:hypothetical protein [Microbacterium suwonense]